MLNRSKKDLSRVKNVVCGFTKDVINSRNPASAPYSHVDPVKINLLTILDNIWHQFTFADDFFEDRDAPSDEQTNIDFGTSSSIDNWKVFNKRGLHLIHLNINSLLSKIDELRAIAKKSRAVVI